jgi:indolepyruvate ferredoxin oxidoreductase beta subunit
MNAILPGAAATAEPICLAVLAMGGQGGGVLVDWIVALAESSGWVAQSTSVPGVAQRTGATIYYVEMIAPLAGHRPVLALMPTPGEVDVVVGAELMEGGRAILRGLVSPGRTTLITSSHRAFAVEEKIVPGDGEADPVSVYSAAGVTAKRFVAFDMAALAEATGSAISAVLFGVLAGSGALPFPRDAYEATIRAAGVGVEPSLRAFAAGFERVRAGDVVPVEKSIAAKAAPGLHPLGHAGYDALVARAARDFPGAAHGMIAAGLRRVVDYQDLPYGAEYLDVLAGLLPLDRAPGHGLLIEAAKYLAAAMAYDDVIRIADLKTRSSRFRRVEAEVGVKAGQIVGVTEFMHPRTEEVCGLLPPGLGGFLEGNRVARRAMDWAFNRGRRVRTDTVRGFLMLYAVAGLRGWRRRTLRHRQEMTHRHGWLAQVRQAAAVDYDLAIELLRNRRLVKGYSDTHARGLSKFGRVMEAAAQLQGREDAAVWVRRLREAALRDEEGLALGETLRTIDSFLLQSAP